MRNLFGPLLLGAIVVAGGSLAPLVTSTLAKAAPMAAPAPATRDYKSIDRPPARDVVPNRAIEQPPSLNNPAQVGKEIDERAAEIYTQKYGPVDQNKPLDYSDQPKAVPRNYVAGQLYNVQVLKQYSYVGLIGQMTYYATSLGVQCTYCHNVGNFAYDTPTKRIARTMQIMSTGVTTAWVNPVKRDYPVYRVAGAVGCVTCHAGKPQFGVKWNMIPVQYLDNVNKSTKQAGYVVNSMYGVSKSLGVNCLHCHNSADFISLQYYPTNKIAHRMWAMVDDINHKYLPPNIEAVTCYTCHQGNKWPQALVTAGLDQTPVKAIAAHPEVQENPGGYIGAEVAH